MITVSPIVVLLLNFSVLFVRLRYCVGPRTNAALCCNRTRTRLAQVEQNHEMEFKADRLRSTHIKLGIYLLFLVYPTVSATIFTLWNCKERNPNPNYITNPNPNPNPNPKPNPDPNPNPRSC